MPRGLNADGDISVPSAYRISNHRLILIEGNPLPYNQHPWDCLHGLINYHYSAGGVATNPPMKSYG